MAILKVGRCAECGEVCRWNEQKPGPMLCSKCRNRRAHRLRTYDLSAEEYQALVAKHNNECPGCHRMATDTARGKLVIDHCHVTGRVRGLLCTDCNSVLGYARDSTGTLARLIQYLAKHRPKYAR